MGGHSSLGAMVASVAADDGAGRAAEMTAGPMSRADRCAPRLALRAGTWLTLEAVLLVIPTQQWSAPGPAAPGNRTYGDRRMLLLGNLSLRAGGNPALRLVSDTSFRASLSLM